MKQHRQWWPKSSADALPPLSKELVSRLDSQGLDLPINEECTSVAISPTGCHFIAGFTDGTLRIFDLTGRHHPLRSASSSCSSNNSKDSNRATGNKEDDEEEEEFLFDSDTPSNNKKNNQDVSPPPPPRGSGKTTLVCSKSFQGHGAVACQIHAKGVHTSLRMEVDISCDGMYAFGGVARGSMEMVAVDLSQLLVDTPAQQDLLDSLEVHRHADAKLRGFGACTRLQYHHQGPPKYLLLTGKGIKNIHIWSFTPSEDEWQCLYDTQTNGTSINLLNFRYSSHGHLQAMSKSDDQKLRVWDLSHEQREQPDNNRSKRPPFHDVPSSESTLGVGGSFALGGRNSSLILVNLDISGTVFNHTEVAMPGGGGTSRRTGRQQRGDLKSLANIAAMPLDSSHALLEMSDGSVVHFSQGDHLPSLKPLTNFPLQDSTASRSLCLGKIGSSGVTVAIVASSYAGRGTIGVRQLAGPSPHGFWGYCGTSVPTPKRQLDVSALTTPVAHKKPKTASPLLRPQPVVSPPAVPTSSPAATSVRAPAKPTLPAVSPEPPAPCVIKKAPRPNDNAILKFFKSHSTKEPSRKDRYSMPTKKKGEEVVRAADPKKLNMKRRKELKVEMKKTELEKQGSSLHPPPVDEKASNHIGHLESVQTKKLNMKRRKELKAEAKKTEMGKEKLGLHPPPVVDEKVSSSQGQAGSGQAKKLSMKRRKELKTEMKKTEANKGRVTLPLPSANEKMSRRKGESETGQTKSTKDDVESLVESSDGQVESKTDGVKKQAKEKQLRSLKAPAAQKLHKNSQEKKEQRHYDTVLPKVLNDHTVEKSAVTPEKFRPPVTASPNDSSKSNKKSSPKTITVTKGSRGEMSVTKRKRSRSRTAFHPPPMLAEQLPPIPKIHDFWAGDENDAEGKRITLALEFRVAHEILRRNLFASIDAVVSAVFNSDSITSEQARSWGEDSICRFEGVLEDLLARQELEASVFQWKMAVEGHPRPRQAVSFPFPEAFDQARQHLELFLSKRNRPPRLHKSEKRSTVNCLE